MADPEVVVDTQTPQEDDTEMQNVPDITVDESMAGGSGEGDEAGLEDIEPTITERVGFVEWAGYSPRKSSLLLTATSLQLPALAHRRACHWIRRCANHSVRPPRPPRASALLPGRS